MAKNFIRASSDIAVVKHSLHHPKANGLSPTTASDTMREKNGKNLKCFEVAAQW
jgi:hypothetical protein